MITNCQYRLAGIVAVHDQNVVHNVNSSFFSNWSATTGTARDLRLAGMQNTASIPGITLVSTVKPSFVEVSRRMPTLAQDHDETPRQSARRLSQSWTNQTGRRMD